MAHSPSSAHHLVGSKDSSSKENVAQSLERFTLLKAETAGNDKASKKAPGSTTAIKSQGLASKSPVRKKGVAQIIKAPPKRPREVYVTASTTIGVKRKRRNPSADHSEDDEAQKDSSNSAVKRGKQVYSVDSIVKADEEARIREAQEDDALDEAEKKIKRCKKIAKAEEGGAKGEARKSGAKKARPQKKSRKEGIEEEE